MDVSILKNRLDTYNNLGSEGVVIKVRLKVQIDSILTKENYKWTVTNKREYSLCFIYFVG